MNYFDQANAYTITIEPSDGHKYQKDQEFQGNNHIHLAIGSSFEVMLHFVVIPFCVACDVVHISIGFLPIF